MTGVPFLSDRPDLVHAAILDVLSAMFPTVNRFALFDAERGNQAVAWARHVGIYVLAVRFGANVSFTARAFGRDRSTVLYACRLVGRHAAENAVTAALIDFVEAQALARLRGEERAGAAADFLPPIQLSWEHVNG